MPAHARVDVHRRRLHPERFMHPDPLSGCSRERSFLAVREDPDPEYYADRKQRSRGIYLESLFAIGALGWKEINLDFFRTGPDRQCSKSGKYYVSPRRMDRTSRID
jgi:hypothetical protein